MRHIGIVVTALSAITALSACGASSNPGSTLRGQLHVVATVAPTCPVQKAGEPPCVAPYQGKLEILDAAGHHVREVTTNSAGIADLSLAPGPYTIAAPRAGVLPRLGRPVYVIVTASITVTARVELDTGIR